MRFLLAGAAAVVCSSPVSAEADPVARAEIHYAPEENLELVDAQEIGGAELSIDMAAYVLSDPHVIEALTAAAERDVVVRLYFDKSQFAQHGLRPSGADRGPARPSQRLAPGSRARAC